MTPRFGSLKIRKPKKHLPPALLMKEQIVQERGHCYDTLTEHIYSTQESRQQNLSENITGLGDQILKQTCLYVRTKRSTGRRGCNIGCSGLHLPTVSSTSKEEIFLNISTGDECKGEINSIL